MKNIFINKSLALIKKYYPNYDDIKIAEIKYGLEGMYLTITKLVIIFSIALMLNIYKEMLLLLIFFNIMRTTGFGLHATKSWICLLSSTLIFIGLPFVSKIIIISLPIKIILGALAIILVYKYAPADTKKRPLINPKTRRKLKIKTIFRTTILIIFAIIIKNNIISNLAIFGIYTEIILIIPISYKIFNLSYNNYLTYKLQMD